MRGEGGLSVDTEREPKLLVEDRFLGRTKHEHVEAESRTGVKLIAVPDQTTAYHRVMSNENMENGDEQHRLHG